MIKEERRDTQLLGLKLIKDLVCIIGAVVVPYSGMVPAYYEMRAAKILTHDGMMDCLPRTRISHFGMKCNEHRPVLRVVVFYKCLIGRQYDLVLKVPLLFFANQRIQKKPVVNVKGRLLQHFVGHVRHVPGLEPGETARTSATYYVPATWQPDRIGFAVRSFDENTAVGGDRWWVEVTFGADLRADGFLVFPEQLAAVEALPEVAAVATLAGQGTSSVVIGNASTQAEIFVADTAGLARVQEDDLLLKWIGGYFETFWSVNPWWTPKFDNLPEHEVTRGVKPFAVNDEWYYHMRFVDGMKGVTPILSAVPELKTVNFKEGTKGSSHGGNPDVFEAVKAGKPQHMAWAYERPGGGRGFGFTGYHNYYNLQNDSFRTLLLNAVAWTAGLEVPQGGVPSRTPTKEDLDELIKETLRVE